MAHFTCVGATGRGAARDPRRDPRRPDRERAGAARRPAAGRDRVDEDRGRPQYSTELIELIRGELRVRRRRGCFPEVHLEAESPEADLRFTKEKQDAGATVPDHAALLRQRALLRLRRARARGRHHRADHPGHHAGHELRPDQADDRDVRRLVPRACEARARGAQGRPRRDRRTWASPTRRCSARTCSRAARPASTSTRSTARPATRAILAALRAARPWDRAARSSSGVTSSAQLQVAQVTEDLGQRPVDHHRREVVRAEQARDDLERGPGSSGPLRAPVPMLSSTVVCGRPRSCRSRSRNGRPWPARHRLASSPSALSSESRYSPAGSGV